MMARRDPDASQGGSEPGGIVVACTGESCAGRARELAVHVGAPCIDVADARQGQLVLRVDSDGLALVRDGMELRGDFSRMAPRLKQGSLQREMLVKAARIKGGGAEHPVAIDGTAGLGEDSLLLAAAGFEVTLCEADPVIAALLKDAVSRAASDPVLGAYAARMHVVEGDSCAFLRALTSSPDVVYLDPMFPGRTKSAAVKKKFQLIHGLESPCSEDAELELMQAALACRPRKIVIKRPVKGPHLAGVKPSHSIAGKAVRYDCVVPPR